MKQAPPIEIAEALRGFEGKWVALKEGVVVGAATTAYDLYADLHARQIKGTTILRVPAEDEPELVGLG